MSFTLVIDAKVGFKVKGFTNNAKGVAVPFDFKLTCLRLDADQIQDKLKQETDASIAGFLGDVIEDWEGVRDADGKAIPYSTDALEQVCKMAGLGGLIFRTYLAEVGAKEKN